MSAELTTREAGERDLDSILELLEVSMGRAEDPRFETLFRWKHLDNAFGRSPMWVACDGDDIVGLRVFMRWEFDRGGAVVRCVRAVDTATHPDYQGRGIFRRLTLDALPALETDGVDFVFNTPNSQSLPGYLKMGWITVGRAAARVRPLSVRGAIVLARNRVPAAHWSESVAIGVPAAEVVAAGDLDALVTALTPARSDERLRTRQSPTYLRWRYGVPLLHYRAVVAPSGLDDGVAFVRVRRRGDAREAVVASLLVPQRSRRRAAALVREVRRQARGHADYLLGVGDLPGSVGVPTFGPVVAARSVSTAPPTSVADFDLTMGDVELF
jgi:hypothetical protein